MGKLYKGTRGQQSKNKWRVEEMRRRANFDEPEPQKPSHSTWKDAMAYDLKRNPTPAEEKLSRLLRGIPGTTFNQSVLMFGYILDFYDESLLLAIEADSPSHNKSKDGQRDRNLARHGIKTIRLSNHLILTEAKYVVGYLHSVVESRRAELNPRERKPRSLSG